MKMTSRFKCNFFLSLALTLASTGCGPEHRAPEKFTVIQPGELAPGIASAEVYVGKDRRDHFALVQIFRILDGWSPAGYIFDHNVRPEDGWSTLCGEIQGEGFFVKDASSFLEQQGLHPGIYSRSYVEAPGNAGNRDTVALYYCSAQHVVVVIGTRGAYWQPTVRMVNLPVSK